MGEFMKQFLLSLVLFVSGPFVFAATEKASFEKNRIMLLGKLLNESQLSRMLCLVKDGKKGDIQSEETALKRLFATWCQVSNQGHVDLLTDLEKSVKSVIEQCLGSLGLESCSKLIQDCRSCGLVEQTEDEFCRTFLIVKLLSNESNDKERFDKVIDQYYEEKVLPLTRLKNLEATRLRQINASRRNSNQARQQRIKSVEEKWKDPEYVKCAHAEGRSFFGENGDWQKAWDGR